MEYDAYDPTLPSRREDAPEDHKNVAYWSCVALGAGILFPWNAWITAVDYFEMTYPGRHVDRVFPVLYFFPNVCALLVVLKHGHRLSQRARVRGGFVVFLLCLLAPAFASFAVVCVAVALTGAADAFAQGSLFGVVAPMLCHVESAQSRRTTGRYSNSFACAVSSRTLLRSERPGARADAVAAIISSRLKTVR